MKIKRRIFGVIALCLLLFAAALAVFADTETSDTEIQYTGTVGEAEAMLSSLDAAKSVKEKAGILDSVLAYLDTVDPDAEGRKELEISLDNAEYEVAKALVSEAKSCEDTLSLGSSLRLLSAFYKKHRLSSEEQELFVESEINALTARFDSEKAKALSELELLTYAKDYNDAPLVSNDFDNVKSGGFTPENNKDSSTLLSFIGEDSGMDGDNCYYTVRYDYAGKHLRATSYLQGVKDSLVFEFDFTTFDSLPHRNVTFEDYSTKNGVTWNVVYLGITPEGNLVRKDEVIAKGIVTPGEWTHISVAVDTVTSEVDIYVDYVLVYSFNAEHPTLKYAFTPTMMRIGNTVTETGGSFSMDNVRIYRGHAPRDLEYYNSLSDKERFIYGASQLSNSDISVSGRYDYYTMLEKSVSNYYLDGKYLDKDSAVVLAVDRFLSFDKDGAEKTIKKINLATLDSYVQNLVSYTPSEENANERAYWVSECETFLASL